MTSKRRNTRPDYLKVIVTIVTLLCIVVGTATVVQKNIDVVQTGIQLAILRERARAYNSEEVKTDKMTEEYIANDAQRQAIYRSDDIVIRTYSNMPAVAKVALWLLALVSIPAVPILVMIYIIKKAKGKAKSTKQKMAKLASNKPKTTTNANTKPKTTDTRHYTTIRGV